MSIRSFGFGMLVFGLLLATEVGRFALTGVVLIILGLVGLCSSEPLKTKEYVPIYKTEYVHIPAPAPIYRPQISNLDDRAIQRAFNKFDRNGNDEIDFYELKTALSDLGFFPITNDLVQSMMNEADVGFSDGKIDFQEFKKICTKAWCSPDWTRARNNIKQSF